MNKTYAIEFTKDELEALNDYLKTDAQDIYDWEILCQGEAPYDPGQLGIAHEKISAACRCASDVSFYFTFEGEFGLEQHEILASDLRIATLRLALLFPHDVGADGAVAWHDRFTDEVHERAIDW